jgi:hypothetical protein
MIRDIVRLVVVAVLALAPGWVLAQYQAPGGTTGGVPLYRKGPIDLNSATLEELRTLPGLAEADAKKIVEHRPYRRPDELVQKKVVPQATYDKIKGYVMAKQPPPPYAAPKQ